MPFGTMIPFPAVVYRTMFKVLFFLGASFEAPRKRCVCNPFPTPPSVLEGKIPNPKPDAGQLHLNPYLKSQKSYLNSSGQRG